MSQHWERTPISHEPLSIVVLAEKATPEQLHQTLSELHKQLANLHRKSDEVLIPVTPTLEEKLKNALSACSHSRFIVHDDISQGVGAALRHAVAAAQQPLLFILPVGFSVLSLSLFLKEIDQVDIVCGVRESKQAGWKRRQFFSKAYQLFGLWMQDPECPMKLFRRETFKQLPIQSQGQFVFTEILAKANFQSRLMTEVVVDGPEDASTENTKDFWKVLNNPDFGKVIEKAVETTVKPMFTTQAPEARP